MIIALTLYLLSHSDSSNQIRNFLAIFSAILEEAGIIILLFGLII